MWPRASRCGFIPEREGSLYERHPSLEDVLQKQDDKEIMK